jgi:hypothetical protein
MNNLSGFWIEMPKFSNFEFLAAAAAGLTFFRVSG